MTFKVQLLGRWLSAQRFEYRYPACAAKALESWCEMAQASGMKSFERLARSFRKGAGKVVAFIKHRDTSGRIEGHNIK